MKTFILSLLVVVVAGCGNDEQKSCDALCLKEIAYGNCCDCLEEKNCLFNEINAQQCVETLFDGEYITLSKGCSEDNDRCGTQCDYLLHPADNWFE